LARRWRAKALLERALPVVKADKIAAFAKFNKGDDGFRDRDLYVFCFNIADGKANAGPPNLIGTDIRTLKDKSGYAFGEHLSSDSIEGQITQVSYMFARPSSTEPVQKVSYITRVADQVCGVGYYK
jgi:signal transduction histidine kinase